MTATGERIGPFVGFQASPTLFVEEGVDLCLDRLVEHGAVNALFVPGTLARSHTQYYAATMLSRLGINDSGIDGADLLEQLTSEAHERGVRVFVAMQEHRYVSIAEREPGWSGVLQIDLSGRRHRLPCFRNPSYLNWWLSIVEDSLKSYDIDGVQYGSARIGPLGHLLACGQSGVDSTPYCFCEHCRVAAEIRGIDVDRAIAGYSLLYDWQQSAGSDPDGERAFVVFLRALLKYPEILAWEQLWFDGFIGLQQQIYGAAKVIAPEKQIGWGLSRQYLLSLLNRAEIDISDQVHYVSRSRSAAAPVTTLWFPTTPDFITPELGRAREWLHRHLGQMQQSVFRGVRESTLQQVYQASLGLAGATAVGETSTELSTDYIHRETERMVALTHGAVPIYPGVDLGGATSSENKDSVSSDGHQAGPLDVREAIVAASEGGASGIVMSSMSSQMPLDEITVAGSTIREVGRRWSRSCDS